MNGIAAPAADFASRDAVAIKSSAHTLDLQRAGIRTIVWATGYRRAYPWLPVPVLNEHGDIVHRGGITVARGSSSWA